MSELMALLIGVTPYPIPAGVARIATFETPEDEVEVCYCPKCRQDNLAVEDFYIRADGRISAWCKVCTKEYAKEQRLNKNARSN